MKGSGLKREIQNLFTIVKDRSTEEEVCIVCPQPGCGDTNGNRSVNLRSGKTFCWRCTKGGDFVKWARHLGYEISQDAVETSDLDMLEDWDRPGRPAQRTPVPDNVKLPAGFTPIALKPNSVYTKLIVKMAERKNLGADDFLKAGVGFTEEGIWEPYCVFPVVEYDQLVYYQGRTYYDRPGENTKRFPHRNTLPLGARYWVYNLNALAHREARVAVVVESILNVLSLEKRFKELGVTEYVPVCVFKHKVSVPQLTKILRYKNIEEICLLFDHDAIGNAWEQSGYVEVKKRASIAEMPAGLNNSKQDANDDVDLAIDSIIARKPYDNVTKLQHRLAVAFETSPMFKVEKSPLSILG